MSDKINVLHVVGRMDRGGTETFLMNLLRTIDRDAFQFDFVEQTEDECDYDREILELGSRIYRCPHISAGNLHQYRKWWRKFFDRHPEYRIVHGHSRGSGPIYLDEANKAGRITIAHCHSNSFGKGMEGIIRRVWQRPLRKIADYNLACSYEAGLSQYGANSSYKVIRNGIQAKKYGWNPIVREKIRAEWNIGDRFVLGNVARFEKPKNHSFLLKIFSEIKKNKPDALLMLVGGGSGENRIHQLADEMGIEQDMIYAGIRDDVHNLLQAMDSFVFPSLYEGLPLALVEAQASGISCFVSGDVISDEVQMSELLHFVSLNDSPEKWAEIILEKTVSYRDRRDMSQLIADSGFDIQSVGEDLSRFYIEIINHE